MTEYKHLPGEIPLFRTELPHACPALSWGTPNPRDDDGINYAWHVLNCMVAFKMSTEVD